ncbi:DJ-1/PfpI family protein [Micromonospora sp. CPCC 206060]|uniref:DJ-1/PfpI family protein n=1 Tax=Micromonospora sp. CPCC 206060 TaxID=3122406 RepID=UPI002FEFAF0C
MHRREFLGRAGAIGTGAAVAATTFGTGAPARAATTPRSAEHPLRVQIVMFDGVEEQDFAGPYEVFSLAGGLTAGAVRTSYVTADRPRSIVAAFGTTVKVTNGWAPHDADLIVVPGGGFKRRDSPGIWPEIDKGVLPRALAAAARPGLTIASLCTGAILLAAAGLTTGRPCTTHTGAKAELTARGGLVKNARVVDDGDLVTAAGITSGLDLALHLIKREIGSDVAVKAEEVLEYQARGTVWTS